MSITISVTQILVWIVYTHRVNSTHKQATRLAHVELTYHMCSTFRPEASPASKISCRGHKPPPQPERREQKHAQGGRASTSVAEQLAAMTNPETNLACLLAFFIRGVEYWNMCMHTCRQASKQAKRGMQGSNARRRERCELGKE